MRILGIDVANCSIICCILDYRPNDPRSYYRSGDFFSAKLDGEGVGLLKSKLNGIHCAALEPTGTHYSRPWMEILSKAGIAIRLVGHDKLKAYRKHLDLPDKNDRADALALACYCWDYLDSPFRFVPVRGPEISRIRDIALRLHFYARLRTPIINRVKQDFVASFPEKFKYRSVRRTGFDAPSLWRWLAGEKLREGDRIRYERELDLSVGTGFLEDSKFDASLLVQIYRRERKLEEELKALMEGDAFCQYLVSFDDFHFGLRISAIFLSQIYPFEKFMGHDGRPEIRKERGASGKFTNRYLSFRRFKAMMGLAPREASSGNISRFYFSGNQLCRKTWWQWCHTQVRPCKMRVTPTLKKLGEDLDKMKTENKPARLSEFKICAKAGELLYKSLCRNLVH